MSGLTLPIAHNEITIFEWKNNMSVNVLGISGEKIYILKKSKFDSHSRNGNLLLIDNDEKKHYAMIKNMSQLLASKNGEHQHKTAPLPELSSRIPQQRVQGQAL